MKIHETLFAPVEILGPDLPRLADLEREFRRLHSVMSAYSPEGWSKGIKAERRGLIEDPSRVTLQSVGELRVKTQTLELERKERHRAAKEAIRGFTQSRVVPAAAPAARRAIAAIIIVLAGLENRERESAAQFGIGFEDSPTLDRAREDLARLESFLSAAESGAAGTCGPAEFLAGFGLAGPIRATATDAATEAPTPASEPPPADESAESDLADDKLVKTKRR